MQSSLFSIHQPTSEKTLWSDTDPIATNPIITLPIGARNPHTEEASARPEELSSQDSTISRDMSNGEKNDNGRQVSPTTAV